MHAFTTFSNCLVKSCAWLVGVTPANCSLCAQLCYGSSLCDRCSDALPRQGNACSACGLPLSGAGEGATCGYCAVHAREIDRCISLALYQPPLDRLISGFKYHGRFADGKTLARLLAEKIVLNYAHDQLPQLLVPVPLHITRWRTRGYNQALEISRTLARELRIPIDPRQAARIKATVAQTALTSATARRGNRAHAFTLRRPTALRGISRIAIIDDVITTMATVNSLARSFRQAGVSDVHAWSLARATR